VVAGLRARGYATVGVAAMPFFRDFAVLREGFDRFEVTPPVARLQNRTLAAMLSRHGGRRPVFCFANYAETHSPFRHEDMPAERDEVDDRYAVRALWRQAAVRREDGTTDRRAFARQVACAEFLDARTGELLDLFAARGRPTTVVVCADHGESLGEDGLFGHAMYHPKVMEVPLLIFRLNAPPHQAPDVAAG
jgi:arylsulfatase A-like enzyme